MGRYEICPRMHSAEGWRQTRATLFNSDCIEERDGALIYSAKQHVIARDTNPTEFRVSCWSIGKYAEWNHIQLRECHACNPSPLHSYWHFGLQFKSVANWRFIDIMSVFWLKTMSWPVVGKEIEMCSHWSRSQFSVCGVHPGKVFSIPLDGLGNVTWGIRGIKSHGIQ
jgi:hypothetical protein